MHNRLTTGDRIAQWNTGADTSCVFCRASLETRNHLFFECSFTERVWSNLVRKLLAPDYTNSWNEILNQLQEHLREKTRQWLFRYTFQTSLYWIWRERNNRRHGEPPTTEGQMAQFIDKQIRNKLSSIRAMGDTRYDEGMVIWFSTR
ncbi:uncharacterized protein LOC112084042 [Eutrema salsugineum]|uniref:uncharacterized protein LOC112084042 n=1 Tax=Eutrema salsugineum TaxID=72664 RepID=UPI000CED11AF|nr:uncharacterized protein LOC112084042 [Eutrema salsugineum]